VSFSEPRKDGRALEVPPLLVHQRVDHELERDGANEVGRDFHFGAINGGYSGSVEALLWQCHDQVEGREDWFVWTRGESVALGRVCVMVE
jgi:hypothetical protein